MPKDVLLVITDISGYTKFMVSNKTSLHHAQVIITELMQAIIKQINIPLQISKLEGDAIFLYAIKDSEHAWKDARIDIARQLPAFLDAFYEKLQQLKGVTNTCGCDACQHIEHLKLKVVVHSGHALFTHVGNFYELAGVDVIIVHRLLKNSIEGDEYILFTEAALQDIPFKHEKDLIRGTENYGEIGTVNTFTYIPPTEHVVLPLSWFRKFVARVEHAVISIKVFFKKTSFTHF